MYKHFLIKQQLSLYKLAWYHYMMFLAILLGVYIRLKGLGTWPLTVDEYYIAKSISNILHYGLPEFPCGGYYTRGILYQYMVAPLILFGLKAEYCLRIIPLIFNVLAMPAIYRLGKKIADPVAACEGKIDRWTKSNLIYTENKFFDVLDNSQSTTLLIVRKKNPPDWMSSSYVKISQKYEQNLFYLSIDQRLKVYKIPGRSNLFGINQC